MKIIALIGDQPNHRFLCERLDREFGLDSIVIVNKGSISKHSITHRVIKKAISFPLSSAWNHMQSTFKRKLKGLKNDKVLNVDNVNSEKVLSLIENIKPELVIVSGTNLLKAELISKISTYGKIMNLHTGISPYIKGGPNCTNWCLSNKDFHLIGNTIMWIDEGIDTGNLIFTEKTNLDGDESLKELHIKVISHAHDMYINAVKLYLEGKKLPNVKQNDISKGQTFYSKQWNFTKAIKASMNYYIFFNEKNINRKNNKVKLVNIL